MDVKKIIIISVIVIIIAAASFFGGYTYRGNRFNDIRIDKDTGLIEQQDNTIAGIESGVEQSIIEVEESTVEIEQSIESVELIDTRIREVETGLQTDIEGISGVIERLQYYKRQSEVLEKSDNN